MNSWWSNILVGALGAFLFLVGKDLVNGFREGWRKSGKPFWAEVAERVQKKRSR